MTSYCRVSVTTAHLKEHSIVLLCVGDSCSDVVAAQLLQEKHVDPTVLKYVKEGGEYTGSVGREHLPVRHQLTGVLST